MALKNDAREWTIREQIVEDQVTGITIQFETMPGSDAPFRLRLYGGDLPFGNREILFDAEGKEAGAGVTVTGLCRAGWLTEVPE